MWLCMLGIIMVLSIWAHKRVLDDCDKELKQIDEDYDKKMEKLNDKHTAMWLEKTLSRHRRGDE